MKPSAYVKSEKEKEMCREKGKKMNGPDNLHMVRDRDVALKQRAGCHI